MAKILWVILDVALQDLSLHTACHVGIAFSMVMIRDGSIVSVSSIISAISILSVSYRIGVYNIGFFDISISYR